jgi:mannosyltransferase
MIVIDGIIFSLQKYGGISTYFSHLCQALINKELDSQILLYDEVALKKGFSSSVVQEKRLFERYRSIDLSSSYSNHSILHSSYYRYSSNKNVKNVITIYDFIYEKFESNYIKRNVHLMQKKQAVKRADAIICISESTRNDFFEYYPEYNPDQVFVTHLAHSSESVEYSPAYKFEKKFDKPFVLFVGMRSVHKNFTACVKALKNINVDLKIVGGGPLNDFESSLLESFVSGRYLHLNNVDNDALNKLYGDAVCLLYPSLYEGFGLPILEAQANGCPVIATNFSSIPEVAGDSAILLNDPSSNQICEAIGTLINPKINSDFVNKGFKNIEKFSWDETVKNTFEIYNQILLR